MPRGQPAIHAFQSAERDNRIHHIVSIVLAACSCVLLSSCPLSLPIKDAPPPIPARCLARIDMPLRCQHLPISELSWYSQLKIAPVQIADSALGNAAAPPSPILPKQTLCQCRGYSSTLSPSPFPFRLACLCNLSFGFSISASLFFIISSSLPLGLCPLSHPEFWRH